MEKKLVVIDLETMNNEDLRVVGSRNYAHRATIRCIATDDFTIINPQLFKGYQRMDKLKDLINGLNNNEIKLVAHNYAFEMNILNNQMNRFLRDCGLTQKLFIKLSHTDFVCTAALSQMCFGPFALAKAANYHLGIESAKDCLGEKLMKRTCTGKLTPPTKMTTVCLKVPCEWKQIDGRWYKTSDMLEQHVADYCALDVSLTRKLLDDLMPKFRYISGDFADEIYEGWKLTSHMNETGVRLDVERCEAIKAIREKTLDAFEKYSLDTFGISSGKKISIVRFVNKDEELIKDLKPWTIRDMKDVPIKKKLLEYKKYDKTSLAKAEKGLAVHEEGRLYDLLRFCGADRTGRWSSHVFQLQNLPRPSSSLEEVHDYFSKPLPEEYSHEMGEMGVSALRTCLIPEDGDIFASLDLASIEYRLACWHVENGDALEASMKGIDIYKRFTQKVLQKDDITKEERQLGKMSMLALQYGVGLNGLASRIDNLGIKVPYQTIAKLYDMYHKLYPQMRKKWKELDNSLNLCYNTGKEFYTTLTSGRKIMYGKLIRDNGKICYTDGGKPKALYGSIIFQHMIQADCRDLILIKALGMRKKGYSAVLSIHDEMVYSITEDLTEQIKKDWDSIPCPQWTGLDIESSITVGDAYFKD